MSNFTAMSEITLISRIGCMSIFINFYVNFIIIYFPVYVFFPIFHTGNAMIALYAFGIEQLVRSRTRLHIQKFLRIYQSQATGHS